MIPVGVAAVQCASLQAPSTCDNNLAPCCAASPPPWARPPKSHYTHRFGRCGSITRSTESTAMGDISAVCWLITLLLRDLHSTSKEPQASTHQPPHRVSADCASLARSVQGCSQVQTVPSAVLLVNCMETRDGATRGTGLADMRWAARCCGCHR